MTLIRVQTGAGGAVGGTASATFGAVPTVGDLGIIGVTLTANNVMTATNGWTQLTPAIQGAHRIALFWKIFVSGDTASATSNICTFTSTTWGTEGDTWNASSGWPANPVNVENSQAIASTASYTTPSVTVTVTGRESVVVTLYSSNVTTSRTWSAEAVSGSNVGTITEVFDSNALTYDDGVISSATGSYQGSATLSTAGLGSDAIAIFTPNAGGLPPAGYRALQAVKRAAYW